MTAVTVLGRRSYCAWRTFLTQGSRAIVRDTRGGRRDAAGGRAACEHGGGRQSSEHGGDRGKLVTATVAPGISGSRARRVRSTRAPAAPTPPPCGSTPINGGLSFGVVGESLAGHQNTVASAESWAASLGVIGITLAGEGCNGAEPTLAD